MQPTAANRHVFISLLLGVIFAGQAYGFKIGRAIKLPNDMAKIVNHATGVQTPVEIKREADKVVVDRPSGANLTIKNPEALPDKPAVPILTPAGVGKVQVESAVSPAVDKWETISKEAALDPARHSEAKAVAEAIVKIDEATKPLLVNSNSPVTPETAEKLQEIFTEAESKTTEAYAKASEEGDEQSQVRLASLYRDLAEEKAFYGVDDNYTPDSYLRIYKNTLACCKVLIDPQNTPPLHTSGSLIGPRHVLTCRHIVEDGTQFRVLFPLKNGQEIKYKAKRIYVGQKRDMNEGPLDFAILELEPNTQDTEAAERQPFPLLTGRAGLDSPVYAVGYSKNGPQVVHDGSEVVFPHELADEKEKHGMHMRIRIAFMTENILRGTTTSTSAPTNQLFEHLYRSQGGKYHYISRAHPVELPVFGVNTDTFRGDSGGPVISRKDSRLCGILITGQPDTASLAVATPFAHEKALPMSVIHEQLTAKLAGWPDAFGVNVD